MTPAQLHILQHSLGVDQYGRGRQYRNHFVTGPGTTDFPACRALVDMGFMEDHGSQSGFDGDHLFWVTEVGRKAMLAESPAPPKVSRSKQRYQQYLNVADCFESFGHYLKYLTKQERQIR